jgi:hypothetical protein
MSAEARTASASLISSWPISPSRNPIWRRQASTISRSSSGSSCWASQARPRTPNRSLTGGPLQVPDERGVDLVLDLFPRLDELGPSTPARRRTRQVVRTPYTLRCPPWMRAIAAPRAWSRMARAESVGPWPRSTTRGRSPASGRSARSRSSGGARRCGRSSRRAAVELRPEESRRALLRISLARRSSRFSRARSLIRDRSSVVRSGPGAALDLRLVVPVAERFRPDAQLLGDRAHGAVPFPCSAAVSKHESDRALLQLGWIPPLGLAPAGGSLCCHDSIFLQAMEPPPKSVRFTSRRYAEFRSSNSR